MNLTACSLDVSKACSLLCFVILVSAQNILGKSVNCSGDDPCKMDEACLNFQNLDLECLTLSYNTIFEGPGPRTFSINTTNTQGYASKNFIVATYKRGDDNLSYKQCCGVEFGELCTLQEIQKKESSTVVAVTKDNELCYKDIKYSSKPGKTVWCCNKTTHTQCKEKLPCMEMENGQIVWKGNFKFISLDQSYTSDYCLFTATNEQAIRGERMTTLVRDVEDFVLNQTTMTVVSNKTMKKCITRRIENLDSKKIAALLPRKKSSETWCFFMKGPSFTNYSLQATCLMPDDPTSVEDFDSTSVVVIATAAVLFFLLLALLAILYFYRYTMRNVFQKKEVTLNTIPKCTKDILKADGEFDNLISTLKKPENCLSSKAEKAWTIEGYTTISPGKKLESDLDRMIEKSEDVSEPIYQMKIGKETNENEDYRDRLDSGMVSDVSCDMAQHIPDGDISNDLRYSSKSPNDYRCPIMAATSYDTSNDSGISSMVGDSGGNILHLEEQTKSCSLQIYDRDTPPMPSKYHSQLPALAEVTFNTTGSVTLEEETGTRGKLEFPIESVRTGGPSQMGDGVYIEKDFLSKLADREQIKGNMFQTSSNNNYLINSDRFHFKPTNASSVKKEIDSKDPPRALDGRMDFEVSKGGEKHQRYSDSSNDTGCGTNSYDEDEYCTKCLLEDNIMFYGDPVCPNYVMKSDMETYAEVGELSEFQSPSSQLDSCA